MSIQSGNSKQRWIRPLPERVINKIAAGEVIERPAAVVKELVENSIDADADKIEIFVEKSGAKLIKIVDNGCGIAEDQIEIAFSRHATSKIKTFDDLNALYTYGFRGEALPSIASVSRLRMVSRTPDAKSGTEIIIEGGVVQSKQPVAASVGTIIEIENLFYNTPARRKFLKAESTETRHIARTAMAMALSRADIGFSYTSNNRNIFTLPPQSSLEERINAVLGKDKKFVPVDGEEGPVKLKGFIGTPEMIQQNRFGIYLFINNRYIQSSSISHALMAGYGEMLPRGKYPIGVLLLNVDVNEVDVNVHPTKAEVRLSMEREVHDSVYRIIKNSLRQDGIIPMFKSSTPLNDQQQAFVPGIGERPQVESNKIPGMATNQVDPSMFKELYRKPEVTGSTPDVVQVNKNTGEIISSTPAINQPDVVPEKTVSSGFRYVGRYSDLYLLIQAGEDLYIVDQHTAHERILFEENLKKVDNNVIEGQAMLFPVQVELNPELMTVYEESQEILNNSGFTVGYFGGRTVNIEAVPSIMRKKSPEKLFLAVLDDIASLKNSGYDLKKAIAQTIACRSAVMAGDRLNDHEAIHLLERLLLCDNKYTCPHGRPTFVKLTKADVDKQFGR